MNKPSRVSFVALPRVGQTKHLSFFLVLEVWWPHVILSIAIPTKGIHGSNRTIAPEIWAGARTGSDTRLTQSIGFGSGHVLLLWFPGQVFNIMYNTEVHLKRPGHDQKDQRADSSQRAQVIANYKCSRGQKSCRYYSSRQTVEVLFIKLEATKRQSWF